MRTALIILTFVACLIVTNGQESESDSPDVELARDKTAPILGISSFITDPEFRALIKNLRQRYGQNLREALSQTVVLDFGNGAEISVIAEFWYPEEFDDPESPQTVARTEFDPSELPQVAAGIVPVIPTVFEAREDRLLFWLSPKTRATVRTL